MGFGLLHAEIEFFSIEPSDRLAFVDAGAEIDHDLLDAAGDFGA